METTKFRAIVKQTRKQFSYELTHGWWVESIWAWSSVGYRWWQWLIGWLDLAQVTAMKSAGFYLQVY